MIRRPVSVEMRQSIESMWRRRAAYQGLKPRSAKRAAACVAYYAGAMAALCMTHGDSDGELPEGLAGWVMLLACGREPGETEVKP